MISSSLAGIVAQRMVRRVCTGCSKMVPRPIAEQRAFEEETALDSALKIGRWEAQCQGGYRKLGEVEQRYAASDSAAMQRVVQQYMAADSWNIVHSLPTENGATA